MRTVKSFFTAFGAGLVASIAVLVCDVGNSEQGGLSERVLSPATFNEVPGTSIQPSFSNFETRDLWASSEQSIAAQLKATNRPVRVTVVPFIQ